MSFDNVLIKAIGNLKEAKRVFCSEADFQQQLAFEINKLICNKESANNEVRLEFPIGEKHIDIMVSYQGKIIPIELKYKTARLVLNGFSLKQQGAQDNACYDFYRDIERIETLRIENRKLQFESGYAIFLTNDSWYYREKYKTGTKVGEFRINPRDDGYVHFYPKNHVCSWEGGECRKRKSIKLNSEYKTKWLTLFKVSEENNSEFKYLILNIGQKKQITVI